LCETLATAATTAFAEFGEGGISGRGRRAEEKLQPPARSEAQGIGEKED